MQNVETLLRLLAAQDAKGARLRKEIAELKQEINEHKAWKARQQMKVTR